MTDRQPLTIQPDWLDQGLSDSELIVLARLDSYWRNGHVAYPSDEFLSGQVAMHPKKVQRILVGLEWKGWLVRRTGTNRQSRGGKFRYLYPAERTAPPGVMDKSGYKVMDNPEQKVMDKSGQGELERESKSGRGGSRPASRSQLTKRQKAHLIAEIDLPPEIPRDKWREFVWDRYERGKHMTELAASKATKELVRLSAAGNDPGDVLEQSIMNGWTGVFPVKHNGKGYNGHQQEKDPFEGCVNRHRWEGP